MIIIIIMMTVLTTVPQLMTFHSHIKLEAELAEMNWRVRWDDILFSQPEKNRKLERQGSRLSLRVSAENVIDCCENVIDYGGNVIDDRGKYHR